MSALRFGIVGAGRIAASYADALARSEHATLAAAADVRLDAARALSDAAFTSHEALLDLGLDAVVICTPPHVHAAIAASFLEAGVAVLCEKPLSVDLASAKGLIAVAQRTGTQLAMASKFRYVADVVDARRMIAEGAIGDVTLFENCFTGRVDMRDRWNAQPELSGGGVLIDNGTHSVDVMRYFLGPLAKLQAVDGPRTQGLAVEETVHLFVQSATGALGSIDLSWSIHKPRDTYIEIYGSDGALQLGWRGSRWKRQADAEWTSFGSGYDKVQAFVRQIDNFAGALAGREELWIGHEDALASVAVIEAAYRSMRQQNWVEIHA